MTSIGVDLLSLNALVTLRLADHDGEYASRIEDVDDDTVIVAAPAHISAELFASGSRDVYLSWVSPRGRYEQMCELVENISGVLRRWRLRPIAEAVLIQRRRFVRVQAAMPILIVFPGETVNATTMDISEGGFRVRMPRREIEELTKIGIRTTMGGTELEVRGFVLRSHPIDGGQTEAIISLEAAGHEADAIRRYVFQMQLRARATRQA